MIILITAWEKDERTGKDVEIVSHGVELGTNRNIVLPNVEPQELGEYDEKLGEWVLYREVEEA